MIMNDVNILKAKNSQSSTELNKKRYNERGERSSNTDLIHKRLHIKGNIIPHQAIFSMKDQLIQFICVAALMKRT